MTYVPVVPTGGAAGWAFLQRTREAQQAAFADSASVTRETERFAERIGEVGSAEELVADRELLTVALGAFGLSDDLNNRFYIQRILEEGATDDRALANRLTDRRYAELAGAFTFEAPAPSAAELVVASYPTRSAGELVAKRDGDHERRLELIMLRELAPPDPDGPEVSEETRWRTVATSRASMAVLSEALDLPAGFGALPLSDRASALQAAAQARFGEDAIDRIAEPRVIEELLGSFLVDPPLPALAQPGFAEGIIARYEARGFEEAVGEQAPDMRLVLNLQRELPALADRAAGVDTLWFTVMGTPPLREVFETAFGLPTSFGTLDVDRQLEVFKERAQGTFGDEGVAQFSDPEAMDELTRLFLARSQIAQSANAGLSSTSVALTLLSGA